MEQAVDYYNDLADIIQQGIDNLRQRQQAQQPRRPPHPPLTITAEKLIAERKEDTVKLFTNFTIEQFEHIYSLVSEALAEGTHKDAMVTPKTKLLLTLLWCRFNETYKPMANRFGIKYTYMRGIVIQTIQRIHPVLEKIFIKWTSVSSRLGANIVVNDFQFLLGSIDATVQRVYRRSVNQKKYYSGKHKMHCMKTQAIVSPTGLLMHHSHCVPGAQHDMSLFKESGLKDLIEKENQECQAVIHQHCTVLADSGYQGLSHEITGGVTPHKKPRGGEFTEQQIHENDVIKHHRIKVENWFGRHKVLWAICAGTFRQSDRLYESVWGLCAALTNYHITLHPLRADEHVPWDEQSSDDLEE